MEDGEMNQAAERTKSSYDRPSQRPCYHCSSTRRGLAAAVEQPLLRCGGATRHQAWLWQRAECLGEGMAKTSLLQMGPIKQQLTEQEPADPYPCNQAKNGAIPSFEPSIEIDPFHPSNLEWNWSILSRYPTKCT